MSFFVKLVTAALLCQVAMAHNRSPPDQDQPAMCGNGNGAENGTETETEDRATDLPPPLMAILGGAWPLEHTLQPLVDFDKDSCYNVPAVDLSGRISEGLPPTADPTKCRDPRVLELNGSNVYSRGRCNRKWCAYLYAYFFQMDWATTVGDYNHRYDWESVVVWAYEGKPLFVAASCHGNYDIKPVHQIRMASSPAEFPIVNDLAATHPKVVFHKDSVRTHCFRFARGRTDEPPENHRGIWIRSRLVGWLGWPLQTAVIRDKMAAYDFGGAHFQLRSEEAFTRELVKAMPKVAAVEGFDCAADDYPMWPGLAKL